jgi:hypothetical protein
MNRLCFVISRRYKKHAKRIAVVECLLLIFRIMETPSPNLGSKTV